MALVWFVGELSQSVCLSVCQSVCQSVSLSVCQSVSLSVCLSVWLLSVCSARIRWFGTHQGQRLVDRVEDLHLRPIELPQMLRSGQPATGLRQCEQRTYLIGGPNE